MAKEISSSEVQHSDLIIDAIYQSVNHKNVSGDVISKVLPLENSGGFRRPEGKRDNMRNCPLLVLFSSLEDPEWPDAIDYETGSFIYYGDNKTAGGDLHETKKGGNTLLKQIFEAYHGHRREDIPVILAFVKSKGRDVVFKGLCVPGYPGYSQTEDLVAIWKSIKNERFQNYKALFSILDIPVIERDWIKDIMAGKKTESAFCPEAYKLWVRTGNAPLLMAEKVKLYRTKDEQLPKGHDLALLQVITTQYQQNPHGFEKCAAELLKLMDKNFVHYDLTRPSRDGGRDAIGTYQIGLASNAIKVTYALEAKCWSIDHGARVHDTSRLISRLLHRQFGVFVTTSYVNNQCYQEIIEDEHPIMIISGVDIVTILKDSGRKTVEEIQEWLDSIS